MNYIEDYNLYSVLSFKIYTQNLDKLALIVAEI